MRALRLMILGCAFFAAGVAQASPAPGDKAASGGHASSWPFPDKADLGVWTLIVFLTLFFVLRKTAWKPMIEALQKREKDIRTAKDDADRVRLEAQTLRSSLQQEMDTAHEKVKALIEEGKRDAQATAADMITKAKDEINQEKERLRRELQVETDQAMQALWSKAADLATQASAAAIGKELTQANHSRLIDEALGELKRVGANGR